jgi:hypothetical protein
MRLSERYALDRDIGFDRSPRIVAEHLETAGLTELATFDIYEDEVRRYYVATDAGLYVGTYTLGRSGWGAESPRRLRPRLHAPNQGSGLDTSVGPARLAAEAGSRHRDRSRARLAVTAYRRLIADLACEPRPSLRG